jgi:hypothetical protein
MSDLIGRLLDRGVCSIHHNSCRNDGVCEEAAAALGAKDAEIARLLRIIDKHVSGRSLSTDDYIDVENARAALTEAEKQAAFNDGWNKGIVAGRKLVDLDAALGKQ